MKYRKKSVVNEAEQWFPGKHVEGVQEIVHDKSYNADYPVTVPSGYGMIETLSGPVKVEPGDWIITQQRPEGAGTAIDRYPCKPDIFAATYEEVIAE